jgi:hypothetical protein
LKRKRAQPVDWKGSQARARLREKSASTRTPQERKVTVVTPAVSVFHPSKFKAINMGGTSWHPGPLSKQS